jgi:isocitrate/isopropylmalate dehydrogenase
MKEAACRIEKAISDCIYDGECTPDLGGSMTTSEAGAAVRQRVANG